MGRCHLVIVLLSLALVTGCGQKAPQRDDVPSGSQAPEHDSVAQPDEPAGTDVEGPAFPAPPSEEEPLTASEPAEVGAEPPSPVEAEPIPREEFPRETGARDGRPRMAQPAPRRPAPSEEAAEPPMETEAEAENERDNIVQVFYATDRKPHLPPGSKAVEWSLYFPAIAGVVITLILSGLAARLRSKLIILALAVTSFLITLYLGQQLVVRMQQVRRAAEFGDRTYGETRHEGRRRQPVLELGLCEVSIPPDHRVGKVESPSILRLEFREDPEKHVVLQRTVRLEPDDFYASLRQTVGESPKQQALVFIHGYRVGFDDAVKRTAQIVFDLKFKGAGICYSWPSNAGLADYKSDEANVGWTVTQLEGFLRELAERSGAKTIHLIAHSMGNRALLAAIERISLQDDGPKFGQVILAAPDVDAGEFRTRYAPAVAKSAQQVTLYASSHDRALIASMRAHHYARAGLSGADIVVTDGVDTVDVSPIDTSLLGHSYYGDNPKMIEDLTAMINLNLPAASREWLERDVLEEEEFYWRFREGLE